MPTVSPAFTFAGVGTSLAKKSVGAAAEVSATLDSIAGINNVAWSVASTDETTATGDYTLTPSGTKGETITFTSGAVGTAGLLQCTVNGGVDPQTGSASQDMTATAKWYVPLADSGEVGCTGETTQSDSTHGSTVVINGGLRRLSSVGGGSLSSITVAAGVSWSQTHTQHASGAGLTDSWSGQAAATGAFDGGDIEWTTGARGGTENWYGDFKINVGPEDDTDTRSAYVAIYAAADFSGLPSITLNSKDGVGTVDGPSGLVAQTTSSNGVTINTAGGTGSVSLVTTVGSLVGTTAGNWAMHAAGSFGGGVKVLFVGNATTPPTTNPSGGGILYAEGGAGKWRGSGGTVTTFGPAEPHCPSCGRDFAHEWSNDVTGEHLAVCVPCMLREMGRCGLNTSVFAFVNTMRPA